MTILTPYTQQDYVSGLVKLQPTGKIWDGFNDQTTYMYKTLYAFAQSFQQVDQDACAVIDEVFPQTSTNLLPVWQETLGLTAGSDSLEEQRSKVVAKLTQEASLARAYYINYAKQLGYDIEIIEYSGIIAGIFRCGDSVGTANDYTYQFDITIVSAGTVANAPMYNALKYDGTNLVINPETVIFPVDSLLTQDPNLQGDIWNNGGVVCVSQSENVPEQQTESITESICYNTIESYVTLSSFSQIILPELPTTDPNLQGQLWNNGGVVCVSQSDAILANQNQQSVDSSVCGTETICSFTSQNIFLPNLPTNDPEINGQLWVDGGVLCISQSEQKGISSKLSGYLDSILPAYITAYYLNN